MKRRYQFLLLKGTCFFILLMSRVAAVAQQPGININAGIAAQYQSNIFALSQNNIANAQVDSIEDVFFKPQLSLSYDMPISLQTLQLSMRTGYSLYRSNKRLDDIDIAAEATLRWALGWRCSGLVSTSYTATPGKLEDSLAESRTREDKFSLSGSTNCAVTSKSLIRLAISQAYSKSNAQFLEANNFNDTYFQAQLVYIDSDILRPFISARLRWLSQPNRVAANSFTSGVDSYVQDVGIGGEWSPSSYLTVNAEGYFTHISGTTARNNPNSFSGHASITWQYSPKVSTKFSATRDVQSSADIGSIAYSVTSLNTDIIWKATPRIDSNLSISYAHRRFERAVRGLANTQIVKDNSFLWELSLLYRITSWIDVKVAAKHRWRNANIEALTYDNSGMSVQLSYSWPNIN